MTRRATALTINDGGSDLEEDVPKDLRLFSSVDNLMSHLLMDLLNLKSRDKAKIPYSVLTSKCHNTQVMWKAGIQSESPTCCQELNSLSHRLLLPRMH